MGAHYIIQKEFRRGTTCSPLFKSNNKVSQLSRIYY